MLESLRSSGTARLADRLAAGSRRFRGRDREFGIFRSALAQKSAVSLFYLHGIGGIGKTALVGEFERAAVGAGRPVVHLDARNIDPSPSAFLCAVRRAIGAADADDPLLRLSGSVDSVLTLDTVDRLATLEPWLRQTFLPQLPAGTIVVLAGRDGPSPEWIADPGWGPLLQVLRLGNLDEQDSRAMLLERRVPEAHHAAALAFTHGHPLALALVADVIATSERGGVFIPQQEPDVVRALLERFVGEVPDAARRRAMLVVAHARATTEAVLSATVDGAAAHELFEWLRRLSFIEQGPDGLFPHDVAREALEADFRWRDPDTVADVHRRLWRQAGERMASSSGRAQERAFFDKLYLHRYHPVGRGSHDYESLGHMYSETAAPRDHASILDIVRRFEGEESSALARHWLATQPDGVRVLRDATDGVLGFTATLVAQQLSTADAMLDPAVRAAWRFASDRGLRSTDRIAYHRLHMSKDGYQELSPVTNLLAFAVSVLPLRCARLAWSFLTFADAGQWEPVMRYINFRRTAEADFTLGGRRYGVFAHDWRLEPFAAWWDGLCERAFGNDPGPVFTEAVAAPAAMLSCGEFAAAVRLALRDYARPERLATSPLLRTRAALEHAKGPAAPADLQSMIRDAAKALQAERLGDKCYAAVLHTYLQPIGSQERVAERLGVAFSTYRYQLTQGVSRLIDILWRREIHGAAPERE
jgi:hypothetical protein